MKYIYVIYEDKLDTNTIDREFPYKQYHKKMRGLFTNYDKAVAAAEKLRRNKDIEIYNYYVQAIKLNIILED